MAEKVSLREKRAGETRQRIVDAALDLFSDRGYDATTVDEIADRADVSPRTFFRYFPTKDALLYHDFDERLDRLRGALLARPADEPAAVAMVAVLSDLVEQVRRTPEERQLVIRLLSERPSLRAYQRETIAGHGERVVAGVLAEREGVAADEPRILAAVATVSACFDVALRAWIVAGADEPFRPRLEATLAAGADALARWRR